MFAIYCQSCADWLQLTRYLNRLGTLKWYSVTKSGYRRIVPELTDKPPRQSPAGLVAVMFAYVTNIIT
jgi:hypothetical protein